MTHNLRKSVERGFERFAHLVYRNRLTAILLTLIFFAALASNLPNLGIDTSNEGFLRDDDPVLITYNEFRDQFGRAEMVIIALSPEEVFDIDFLEKLKRLHEELEEKVPHLDDVTSLINARNTRGEGDELIVEDLLENWPQNEQELAALKKRALENPVYKNLLLSEDGKFTTIVIRTDAYSSIGIKEDVLEGFDDEASQAAKAVSEKREYLTDAENSEVVSAVSELVKRYDSPDFPIQIAGSPVVSDVLKRSMMKDMRRFIAMSLVIIAVVLFALFRRLSGVLMPMVVVILSLLSTFALMALVGTPIKLPTQILPSFLLAVGIGDSVHILAIFYNRFNKTGDKEGSVAWAIGHSGLAVVMTSLTTAAGLASFMTAEVAPIADIGKFASAGVMMALAYTVVLMPAMLALWPLKPTREIGHGEGGSLMDRLLDRMADFATGYAKPIVAVSAAVIAVGLFFALQLEFTHNPLKWFPKKTPIRKATEKIDKELKGTVAVDVVVDTGVENGLYRPDLLNSFDKLSRHFESFKMGELFVGKAWSLADILKEINKALNENREEFYAIPQDKNLIAQEFLLFENSGSDDLEDFVDSQFSKTRFSMKLPWIDVIGYKDFLDTVENKFKEALSEGTAVTVTGMIVLFSRTLYASIYSMGESYLIAGVVITFMMMFLIGNIRIGLISMIPNVMPIVITLGFMKVAGMPLDMFTMMIGSIAMGLAVDDTIHFFHNFRRYYHETGDVRDAVHHTLHTTGRAMLVTSVVLSLGFFIFMFASMNNLFNFGLLTGMTIVLALAADFLLSPAILALISHPAPGPGENNG
ncbi:MAG: RND family transporter [Nitrospinota bacterium]